MVAVFTLQARAAAAVARARQAKEHEANKQAISVFAVRRENSFSWEVRRFGGIVIAGGTELFATRGAAIQAGELVRRDIEPTTIVDVGLLAE